MPNAYAKRRDANPLNFSKLITQYDKMRQHLEATNSARDARGLCTWSAPNE